MSKSKLYINYKEEYEMINNELSHMTKKDNYKAIIISLLFCLFFASAPLAILINCLLFVDYIILICSGFGILFMIIYNLYLIIYYSIIKKILNKSFKYKYTLLIRLIYSLFLGIILSICVYIGYEVIG